jgi:hypothetical protein
LTFICEGYNRKKYLISVFINDILIKIDHKMPVKRNFSDSQVIASTFARRSSRQRAKVGFSLLIQKQFTFAEAKVDKEC